MGTDEILVDVRGVSKKFSRNFKSSLAHGLKDITRSLVGFDGSRTRMRNEEFWAVKDVNFQLRRGECLGLIGHNGAGKSTLLKMLNGLIRPDEGEIVMRGRVGALIELGAGFNPILSGRENVYINGQILGFSKKEIDDKLEAIIEFSEINEFIDAPVQNYSSGMKVRLGFAVAAQMEPDILIIDEVLAVGDIGFRLKCLNRIDTILSKSTVIFVSHAMPQVSRVSSKLLLMDHGNVQYIGDDLAKGIDLYYQKFSVKGGEVFTDLERGKLIHIQVENSGTSEIPVVVWGTDLAINISFLTRNDIEKPSVAITIYDKEQKPIAITILDEAKDGVEGEVFRAHKYKVIIPDIQIAQGVYSISITVSEKIGYSPIFRFDNVTQFQVSSKRQVFPSFELRAAWQVV